MERNAIYDGGGQFRISLYSPFVYHIQRGIKSGSLNLEHSFKYRPIEDYLISRSRWDHDRETLLERSGLKSFAEPAKVLSELSKALYQQYEITNQHIFDGSNPFVSFNKNGFSIKTPKQEEIESEALQDFFPERRYVPLLEVLATVNRYSGFLDELQNWQQRYHRKKPPLKAFYAGIIGLGCEIGTRKMARISQQIAESDLDRTVNWYFSPEGIHAANDRISLDKPLGTSKHLPPGARAPSHIKRRTEVWVVTIPECELSLSISARDRRKASALLTSANFVAFGGIQRCRTRKCICYRRSDA